MKRCSRECRFVGRATPDELANVIVFISSPEASYIAGSVIEVDGAMSAN